MTRTLPPAAAETITNNAAGTEVLNWLIFLQLNLDSGTVYINSGYTDIIWNGQTWLGVGGMGSISGVRENTSMGKAEITVNLSHIPLASLPDFVDEFTTNDLTGRGWTTYIAFLNDDATIKDVVTMDSGFIGSTDMSETAEAGNIELTLLNETARLGMKAFYRMTDQAHQAIWPGDDFFKYVTDTNLAEISWGKTTTTVSGGGGGGGGRSGEEIFDRFQIQ